VLLLISLFFAPPAPEPWRILTSCCELISLVSPTFAIVSSFHGASSLSYARRIPGT
jgi:hypothetical protein